MEGDAGASQLNPTDADDSSFVHVTVEHSSESEVGADQTSPEVTAEDSAESDGRAAQTNTELTAEDSATADDISEAGPPPAGVERGPSRLGRRWFAGIAVALLLWPAASAPEDTLHCARTGTARTWPAPRRRP